MEQIHIAITWLAVIHPALPYLFVPVILFGANYATRRWTPSLWVWLDARMLAIGKPVSRVILALPSVALGALAGVYLLGGTDYGTAMWGALSAVLAPIGHHILKALPIPYDGAEAQLKAAKDGNQ